MNPSPLSNLASRTGSRGHGLGPKHHAARKILYLAMVTFTMIACEPAHRVDLVSTSWLVSKVDSADIPPGDRARVTFDINEVVVLDLRCGSITDRWTMDTDGAALDLLGDVAVAEACGGQTTPIERSQLEALRTVRSWRVETNDRIVLEGGSEVTLERVAEE